LSHDVGQTSVARFIRDLGRQVPLHDVYGCNPGLRSGALECHVDLVFHIAERRFDLATNEPAGIVHTEEASEVAPSSEGRRGAELCGLHAGWRFSVQEDLDAGPRVVRALTALEAIQGQGFGESGRLRARRFANVCRLGVGPGCVRDWGGSQDPGCHECEDRGLRGVEHANSS
jgi:hypothetical protein